jgi:alcohol dehydrogenase YqhD (iron-dependent ADH family)
VGHKGGDWACHTIEHAFSALKPQIAHGEGLGVIFPAWIEYMNQKMPKRFSGWAKDVWDEDNVCRALHKFREKISAWGAPTSLRELGIQDDDLPVLLEIITSSGTLGGFSKLERADIEALLLLAY